MKEAPWLLAPEGDAGAQGRVILDPGESRHAAGPLRLKAGDRVALIDGAGMVASATLGGHRRGRTEVRIDAVERVPRVASGLTLAVGVLAGSAMDMVVQKAVELGVDRLVPVVCDRSQISIKRATTRMDHWLRLSRQALKQCKRAWAMELASPVLLSDLLGSADSVHGVVAHAGGGLVDTLPQSPSRLFLVGPEGGFSPDEVMGIEAAGWPKLRLGPYVLRTETAAIAGAAVLLDVGRRQPQ